MMCASQTDLVARKCAFARRASRLVEVPVSDVRHTLSSLEVAKGKHSHLTGTLIAQLHVLAQGWERVLLDYCIDGRFLGRFAVVAPRPATRVFRLDRDRRHLMLGWLDVNSLEFCLTISLHTNWQTHKHIST